MKSLVKVQYSGFFRRLGAMLLDLHFVPFVIVILTIAHILDKGLFSLYIILAMPFYSIFTEYFFGMTLGKWLVGIKIKTDKLYRPSLLVLARRELLLKPFLLLFFFMGIWNMFFNEKKQTMYDKRLGLVVVVWRKAWISYVFAFLAVLYIVFGILTFTIYPLHF
ncbi:MAG: RDD family protein [Candidatus Roizmanbacteria bacterium]|nr:RDD family protein [Candidatus Roizmanbacteria bacterium]